MTDSIVRFGSITRPVKTSNYRMILIRNVKTNKRRSRVKMFFDLSIGPSWKDDIHGLSIHIDVDNHYQNGGDDRWFWHGHVARDDGHWRDINHGRDFCHGEIIGYVGEWEYIVERHAIDMFIMNVLSGIRSYYSHLKVQYTNDDMTKIKEFIEESIKNTYPDMIIC